MGDSDMMVRDAAVFESVSNGMLAVEFRVSPKPALYVGHPRGMPQLIEDDVPDQPQVGFERHMMQSSHKGRKKRIER